MVLPIKLKHKKVAKMFQQIFSWNKVFRGGKKKKEQIKISSGPISQLALNKYIHLHSKPFHLMEMSSINQLMPHNQDQTLDKAGLACGGNDAGGQD